MHSLRFLLLILSVFLLTGNTKASANDPQSDSLQHVLSHTSDPGKRIDLLLNLKDLNEETDLNVPFSIQLFREATEVKDTYAMSVALIPILKRYSTYAEKDDSLHFYIRTLRRLTPGTPQEGIDIYAEMSIAINRLRAEYDPQKQLAIAREVLKWNRDTTVSRENIFSRVRQQILDGYAAAYINANGTSAQQFSPYIEQWNEALALIRQIPHSAIRIHFASELYPLLSHAYTQAHNYSAQLVLGDEYIRMLDEYFASERRTGRRPHLYTDNAYAAPYVQLIRCAYSLGNISSAETHYKQFRQRMLNASGENLLRNKTYLYEMGYHWREMLGSYDQSLQCCDSLISLIENGRGYFRMMPDKIIGAYKARSRILRRIGHYQEAFASYDQTYLVLDSLHNAERSERLATIHRRNEMDQMQLAETRAMIRSHVTALISAACILLLLTAAGIYFYRGLRRNRRLQGGIIRLSLKAQESERMKSNFLNSICNDIRAPFHTIDQAAWRLMVSEMTSEERAGHLDVIRKSTDQLLSTLDNMLEAASLGSLTERLRFEQTDLHTLCRTELHHIAQQHPNSRVELGFESPEEHCRVNTHARYFSLVIRALLDNAAKFTSEGHITLRCEQAPRQNAVHISVSDTGPGVDPALRDKIFSAGPLNPSAGHGQSLALCALIAIHMQGNIRIDENYSPGARFIFTIPLNP